MSPPSADVLLLVSYAGLLLALAFGFDRLARRTAARSAGWRTGGFAYQADHDAWLCPEDQWLWPHSFDPAQRVMRYRAKPSVCQACPVRSTCTTSPHGREVTRSVDSWPHSEAGRFHRGIACTIALAAVLLPTGMLFSRPSLTDVVILAAAALVSLLATITLAQHLWRTPSGFPGDSSPVPHVTRGAPRESPATSDRFATRWGSFSVTDVTAPRRTGRTHPDGRVDHTVDVSRESAS